MAFPRSWTDKIFESLAVRYGAPFMRQYADIDIDAVKADWCNVLGGLEANPKAISYAFGYLPGDRPVNAIQFRDICRRAPPAEVPKLPAPVVDRDFARQVVGRISRNQRAGTPAQQVVDGILRLQAGGVKLTPAHHDMLASCRSMERAPVLETEDLA